jgi:hypothetical protein
LSPFFWEELERIIKERTTEESVNGILNEIAVIELRPSLDDLWENMIYKLQKEDSVYIVPLWHHELTYEHNGVDFVVKCIPNLLPYQSEDITDDYIWIDSENNIHKNKTYSIHFLLEKSNKGETIKVAFGKKIFEFAPQKIRILGKQDWVWRRCGITKIRQNIYDVSCKGDVILHIYLC